MQLIDVFARLGGRGTKTTGRDHCPCQTVQRLLRRLVRLQTFLIVAAAVVVVRVLSTISAPVFLVYLFSHSCSSSSCLFF